MIDGPYSRARSFLRAVMLVATTLRSAPAEAARWACHTPSMQAVDAGWQVGTIALPWRPRPDAGAARADGGTCFGPVLAHAVSTAHFEVEYEDGVDEQDARDLAAWLEAAWAVEVDALGWRPPVGSDQFRQGVYIYATDLGGAATSTRRCGDLDVAVTVVGRDVFTDREWAADMAAHELLHMLQYATSTAPERWFWEAVATWVTDHVQATRGWSRYVPYYAAAPWRALDGGDWRDPEVFLHMYGRCVWVFWLAERHGIDLPRQLWEAAAALGGPARALDQASMLAAVGLDFEAEYAGFVAATATWPFPDQAWFAPVTPVGAGWDGAPPEDVRPEGLGINHVALPVDAAGTVRVDLTLADGADWVTRLVGATAGAPDVVVDAAAGLPDADRFDAVWLVASPIPRVAHEGGWAWSWEARVEPADAPPPGCGCGHARDVSVVGIMGLGALLPLRRRRPTS